MNLPHPKLCPNIHGRPVSDHTEWVGEEYEKKREAVLKHYDNAVVKTTKFLDAKTETELRRSYKFWIDDNIAIREQFEQIGDGNEAHNRYRELFPEQGQFFRCLKEAPMDDVKEMQEGWEWMRGCFLWIQMDGTYSVSDHDFGRTNSKKERAPQATQSSEEETAQQSNHSSTEYDQESNDESSQSQWATRPEVSLKQPWTVAPGETIPLALRIVSLHRSTKETNNSATGIPMGPRILGRMAGVHLYTFKPQNLPHSVSFPP